MARFEVIVKHGYQGERRCEFDTDDEVDAWLHGLDMTYVLHVIVVDNETGETEYVK